MADNALLELSASYSPNTDYSRPASRVYFSDSDATATKKIDMTVSAGTSATTVELGTFTTVPTLVVYNRDATNYVLATARIEKATKTFATNKLGFADADPDTIADDDSTFLSALYFAVGDLAVVSDATEAGNNGTFLVQTAVAGTLTLGNAETLTLDADDVGTPTIKSRRDVTLKISPGQIVIFGNLVPGSDLSLQANTAACVCDVFGWGT